MIQEVNAFIEEMREMEKEEVWDRHDDSEQESEDEECQIEIVDQQDIDGSNDDSSDGEIDIEWFIMCILCWLYI